MDRIFNRLFFTSFCVLLLSFLLIHAFLTPLSLGWILILSITIAFSLTFLIERLFLKPIQQMKKATEKMARGDFQGRVSLGRKDELGDLAHNLNQMSAELQNKIMEIMQDKNELQAILSNMVEGVIVIGKNEKILLLSPPVCDMLELRSNDAIGRPYWEVIRNEEINHLLEEAMAHKQSLQKEIMILSPTEAHFSMQISSVDSDSGELSAVIAVFHDITELKQLARMRSEFVANVSHELKTPLTTIKGFVETLRDGAMQDKEKSEKFLSIIQRHTERLEYLVNDLLTLSAIETKELSLDFEKAALTPIIENIVHLYKDKLDNKQMKMALNIQKDLPLISVDRLKIEQIFSNLLDNAIKFTPAAGVITISAHQENEFVRIDFKDTGIGIPAEHLPRIFERFYRVDKGRSRDLGGTGLGLSIVKHIAQIHNGKVSVQSEPDKGSTFSVFIPASV